MDKILKYFVEYAPLVYMGLGLGGLFVLRRLINDWREVNAAVFGLEREIAHQRFNQTLTVGIVILLLVVVELVLTSFLAPLLPAIVTLTTPTINPLVISTGTLSSEMANLVTGGLSIVTPNAIGCIPDQIMLTSPIPGQVVHGQITLVGTVNVPNFAFYYYEITPAGSDTWSPIQAGKKPIIDGELGFWNTSELTPGDYLLRLVVTDNQGQTLPPCIVPVRVTNQ